ncbi:MAG: hypothetical protein Fur0025_36200 [Oscillatoriaceae cyanobacterium]
MVGRGRPGGGTFWDWGTAVRPYALRAGYANDFAQDRLRSPTGGWGDFWTRGRGDWGTGGLLDQGTPSLPAP